jgi:RimJ/RimL family protein N-acetyltransferase
MIAPLPIQLEGYGIRLEPLNPVHSVGLSAAAADGKLWELWYTSVPTPEQTDGYIAEALDGQGAGHMLPWAVRELSTDTIAGSTRFHDIAATIDRVEIGYTWYAAQWQRTHVNTSCKLLLLTHAFEGLGCRVVGFRTDNFNFGSRARLRQSARVRMA